MLVVDYSWARPDLDAIKAAGALAVVRYLARKVDAKLLQAGERDALHAAGLGIGLVWETTAARSGEGPAAGLADVADAERLADTLGAPPWVPIFYAVDFDATADQVRPYMRAVLDNARRPVGLYGSFRVVEGLPEVPWVWQCSAWSYGRRSTRAHLYQRVGGTVPGTDDNELLRPIPFWHPGGAMWTNPTTGKITSGYGMRNNPATGVYQLHAGTDVANAVGTPVRAAAGGAVVYAGQAGSGLAAGRSGLCVILTHDVADTYYGHLSRIDVTPGQKVKPGDVIGLMGATGNVTGPHLHFEVRPVKSKTATTDPIPYLTARGATLGVDTTPQEDDDMALAPDQAAALNEVRANAAWIAEKLGLGGNGTPFDSLAKQLADLKGQVAGLSTALGQVAGGQDVDLDAIRAAAREGAAAAIAAIDVTVRGA